MEARPQALHFQQQSYGFHIIVFVSLLWPTPALAILRGLSWTSLAVQWLRLRASTAGGAGSIPGLGNKILHAARCGLKKKKKRSLHLSPSFSILLRQEGFLSAIPHICLLSHEF